MGNQNQTQQRKGVRRVYLKLYVPRSYQNREEIVRQVVNALKRVHNNPDPEEPVTWVGDLDVWPASMCVNAHGLLVCRKWGSVYNEAAYEELEMAQNELEVLRELPDRNEERIRELEREIEEIKPMCWGAEYVMITVEPAPGAGTADINELINHFRALRRRVVKMEMGVLESEKDMAKKLADALKELRKSPQYDPTRKFRGSYGGLDFLIMKPTCHTYMGLKVCFTTGSATQSACQDKYKCWSKNFRLLTIEPA